MLLKEPVDGITSEQKIKYMKKWVRDYENNKIPSLINSSDLIQIDSSLKIGHLVRTTLDIVIKNKLLTSEKVRL
jgi:hypothetical protein